ncbi:MAG: 30S ribosomal protein S5 alanine N-acetyltransferase, partial [Rhizobiaceae bacterium]|nr:30S ribosomal protein S5 alanine N-acetyltransferase [Rhizobiaceae bacterium]
MGMLDGLFSPAVPTMQGQGVLLRMPRGADYESWRRLRHRSRDFLTPWEPSWTTDELSRKAYRIRLMRYRQDARE